MRANYGPFKLLMVLPRCVAIVPIGKMIGIVIPVIVVLLVETIIVGHLLRCLLCLAAQTAHKIILVRSSAIIAVMILLFAAIVKLLMLLALLLVLLFLLLFRLLFFRLFDLLGFVHFRVIVIVTVAIIVFVIIIIVGRPLVFLELSLGLCQHSSLAACGHLSLLLSEDGRRGRLFLLVIFLFLLVITCHLESRLLFFINILWIFAELFAYLRFFRV